MADTPYTAAPWTKLPKNNKGTVSIQAYDGTCSICSVSQWAEDDEKSDPEQDANANLILAAPDMLEALEAWFKCLMPNQEEEWRNMHLFNSADALKKCKAAVEKARGAPVETGERASALDLPAAGTYNGSITQVKLSFSKSTKSPYVMLTYLLPENKNLPMEQLAGAHTTKEIQVPLRLSWLYKDVTESAISTSVSSIAVWLKAVGMQEPQYGWIGITGCTNAEGEWVYVSAEDIHRLLEKRLLNKQLRLKITHLETELNQGRKWKWTNYSPVQYG